MKSTFIHPTAVVSPDAQLGEGCEVGPFCLIGPHVVIGDHTRLQSHVVVDGHTTIGSNCNIYPFACIGKQAEDLKHKGGVCRVEIGDRNEIREYVTINAPTHFENITQIGNDCMLQGYCHVSHECILGNRVIMNNGSKMAGHVTIDDFALIGAMAGIQQFIHVGTMAMVGGYSKQTQDLLPFCISDGVPARTRALNRIGMERHGKSSETIHAAKQVFQTIIRSYLTLKEAIVEAESQVPLLPEVQLMLDFARKGTRGLGR